MNVQNSELTEPLAIICGGGALPFAVADAVLARGRKVVLFPIEGVAEAKRVADYSHRWIAVSRPERLYAGLRDEGCRDVVLIGSLTRPPLSKIRFGLRTLLMLPTILSSFRGGDNHLLSKIERVFARYGFRVVGAHEVAPEILIGEGDVTRRKPQVRDLNDIGRGLALLRAIGPFDVGQAAVVIDQHVLAVEGIEGTDAMLARVAELRRRGRVITPSGAGVLVKAPKPNQDRRFDLPAIGPNTVNAVLEAGLAGIAVVAGEAIVASPEQMVRDADQANLFVTGVKAEH